MENIIYKYYFDYQAFFDLDLDFDAFFFGF